MSTTANDEEEELSQLLAALATGVRAVTRLPTDEDEFRFCASLPEFQNAHQSSQTALLELLKEIVSQQPNLNDTLNGDTSDDVMWDDINDPLLWEHCADVCDAMLERIEQQLDAVSSATAPTTAFVQQARQQARNGLDRMIANTMDISKPQLKFVLFPAHNHRTKPFVPKITKKPNAIAPLDLTLQPMSLDNDRNVVKSSDFVQPSHFVPHVYRAEIKQLKCPHFDVPAQRPPRIRQAKPSLKATWIDTKEGLQSLVDTKLMNVDRIALDLEAHSYRSFAGIVCLMQISFKDSSDNSIYNFLVDTLALHDELHDLLLPVLTDPNIVKIMHGADSDIMWLQRDFSLFIVNLMDTGQAARALSLPSAGYAYLLQKYTSIKNPDKSFQLADWRKRPLSEEMQQYAIQDTHYLLDIYNCLLYDLDHSTNTSVERVWRASQNISLSTYKGVPFSPNGYQKLLRQRGRNVQQYTPVQQLALQRLWDWRDATARVLDESVPYIITNAVLLRLATALPTSTAALQTLFNPMPPILWQHATDVTQLLQRLVHHQLQQLQDNDDDQEEDELDVNDTAGAEGEDDGQGDDDDEEEEIEEDQRNLHRSAFFKPASGETRDGFVSPVLGTEALYKQAGWMTPNEQQQEKAIATSTSATEDESIDRVDGKPKRLLSVHPSNQDFRSGSCMEHSIGRGRSVDGMHTVRAIRAHSTSPVPNEAITSDDDQQQQRLREQSQALLGQKQPIPVILGMISPANDKDDEEEEAVDVRTKEEPGEADDTDEELTVPRSMREIYRISNRNRRNKQTGSLTPERGMTPTDDKERNELVKAELLIKERGAAAQAYFESSPKRPRTQTGRESEESVPQENNDDEDISFMQEIGWIKDPKEAEEMLETRFGVPKQSPRQTPVEYTNAVGVLSAQPSNNPFFAGAALAGGTLTHNFARSSRKTNTSNVSKPKPTNNSRRQQERPEKKDGKSHAYRKKYDHSVQF
ncbi:exosome complex exonuclease RRP6 [Fistulifera solaris]|uniref:Exosome complex exonuclease RRP6 n=1 Tax=Fistulifera solaris TaxID=1519565 RepID=A0A1Z5K4S9_FISSO|nr:exosome complex exonuclease RRP6 [Fistulifera solaris]|eukprot:GAX20968.1 exosome complex exonuclease RRP6 [Fistulifera solaris]